MKTTVEYLNEAKNALAIDSDYKMAQWLGVPRNTVSNWRTSKNVMDDYAAIKIAEALKVNPLEVIAAANMEREKDERRREFWENFSRRIAAAVLLFSFFPTDGFSQIGESIHNQPTIHYAKLYFGLYLKSLA